MEKNVRCPKTAGPLIAIEYRGLDNKYMYIFAIDMMLYTVHTLQCQFIVGKLWFSSGSLLAVTDCLLAVTACCQMRAVSQLCSTTGWAPVSLVLL